MPNTDFEVEYWNKLETIKTLEELNICGIRYCKDSLKEEDRNCNDKIEKLKTNLKKWIKRRLTLEGKSLIVKTFGILQLICSLQALPLELKKEYPNRKTHFRVSVVK